MASQEDSDVFLGKLGVKIVADGLAYARKEPVDEKEGEAQPVSGAPTNICCEWDQEHQDGLGYKGANDYG